MKCLARNKQCFYYGLYSGKTPKTNSAGQRTGTYTETYSTPVKCYASISEATGSTSADYFGVNVAYDRIIVTDDMSCPITETTAIWIDNATNKPHDYKVVRKAKSLNNIAYAIAKVEGA